MTMNDQLKNDQLKNDQLKLDRRTISIEDFKKEFELAQGIQMNSAGLSPLSKTVADEVLRLTTTLQMRGGLSDPVLIPILQSTRESVARFLGAASADQVAFTPNCATALSTAAFSRGQLKPGDRVVTLDQEYSSNFYPWKVAAERSGAELKVVNTADLVLPGSPTFGRIRASELTKRLTDRVIEAIQPGTKLVGVSWVQFQTGALLDLKRLGDHAHSVGARLIVDAIQGLGQLPFCFDELPVDLVASGSHKWICGMLGQGFFAVKPDYLAELEPLAVGGGTFNRFGTTGDPELAMEKTARKFEAGGFNFVSLAALKAAVDLIQAVENDGVRGPAAIAKEIESLSQLLRSALTEPEFREAGLELSTPVDQPGGVTSFVLPLEWEACFLRQAQIRDIAVSKRGPFIRVAMHALVQEKHIEEFLSVLRTSQRLDP